MSIRYKNKINAKTDSISGASAVFYYIFSCRALRRFSVSESVKGSKADYTAQTTIGRVKSQLNHYLAESNLMKHMIEAGYTVDDEEFSVLSSLMQDDQNVIKAHELAKDGIVTLIYPMSGNEAALGLNMLEHPARKQEARLAKELSLIHI